MPGSRRQAGSVADILQICRYAGKAPTATHKPENVWQKTECVKPAAKQDTLIGPYFAKRTNRNIQDRRQSDE